MSGAGYVAGSSWYNQSWLVDEAQGGVRMYYDDPAGWRFNVTLVSICSCDTHWCKFDRLDEVSPPLAQGFKRQRHMSAGETLPVFGALMPSRQNVPGEAPDLDIDMRDVDP